jgi:uncharacterized protein YdhG (YjbR/CyaY superfamily)
MKRRVPESIDEYIAGCPAPAQKKLEQIRAIVRRVAPEATEKISYQMPCFFLNGNLVYFAAFAKHIGFFPGSGRIVFGTFKEELSRYKSGKGSVQFPLEEPLPLRLIEKIVRWRAEENRAKPARPRA